MPREDGFAIADLDPSYFADAKLKRLWRELHDPARMAEAVVLHLSTILDSWATGDRVAVEDAAPMWLDVDPALRAALETCGLLGKDGKVPPKTWESWFTPAVIRRAARRKGGAKGGRGRHPEPPTDSSAIAQQPLSDSSVDAQLNPSTPSSPSVPSYPASNPSIPQRRNGKGPSFKGTNDREERENSRAERIAAIEAKLADPSLSPAIREAALAERSRLRAAA